MHESQQNGARARAKIDGRRARSRRTRQELIEAYLALAREKGVVPTAGQVARRAGCSQRSVFERFASVGQLGLAVFDHVLDHLPAPPAGIGRDGDDRRARIEFGVAARASNCEAWLPLWSLASQSAGTSQAVESRIAKVRDVMRDRLVLMFAPELAVLRQPRRGALLITLEALMGFDCWARLRNHYGLSIEQARSIWVEALDQLLPAAA